MTIDNGGTKNNQSLLRLQRGLGIYRSNIYLDLRLYSHLSLTREWSSIVARGRIIPLNFEQYSGLTQWVWLEWRKRIQPLVICSLVSGCRGLDRGFSQKTIILLSCNFTRTDRTQWNRWTFERWGDTDAWLYLYIPSRDRSRNVEETWASGASASVRNLTNTALKHWVTLIIRSITMLFYECVTVCHN